MKKDIRIKITGSHSQAGTNSEPEVTELETTGVLFEKDGSTYIKYKEYMDDTDIPVENLLKFDENSLQLTKRGSINSVMAFNREKSCAVHYITPVGPVNMNIFTEEYNIKNTDEGCNIDIQYLIDYHYDFVVNCGLNVTVDFLND